MFGKKKGSKDKKNKFKFPKVGFTTKPKPPIPVDIGSPYNVVKLSGGSGLHDSFSSSSSSSSAAASVVSLEEHQSEILYWSPGEGNKPSIGHYRHHGSGDIYATINKNSISLPSLGSVKLLPPPVKPKSPAVQAFIKSLNGGGGNRLSYAGEPGSRSSLSLTRSPKPGTYGAIGKWYTEGKGSTLSLNKKGLGDYSGIQPQGIWKAPWMGSDGKINLGGKSVYGGPSEAIAGIFAGKGGWVHITGGPGGFGSRLGGLVVEGPPLPPPRTKSLDISKAREQEFSEGIKARLSGLSLSGHPLLDNEGQFKIPRVSTQDLSPCIKPTPPPKPDKSAKKVEDKPPVPPKPILKKPQDARPKRHRRGSGGYDAVMFQHEVNIYGTVSSSGSSEKNRPSVRAILRGSPSRMPVRGRIGVVGKKQLAK